MKQKNKLWSGAFEKVTDSNVEQFTASVQFDQALYSEEIACSIAHAKLLKKQKIITANKEKAIIGGLKKIKKQIENNKFNFHIKNEDIHLSVESALFKLIGKDAGFLHTGRSRNDLIATDLRLHCIVASKKIIQLLINLRSSFISLAKKEQNTLFPGYTHLQIAQPILLAHHLLAYESMLARDTDKFTHVIQQANVMPLGSGALAGSGYNFDRNFLANELGFDAVSNNSMDAVSDRDFVIDMHSAIASCMIHLSRLSEEIILWATKEFNLVQIGDDFATGSSIMPQKKNPDVAELIRGKSARAVGNLVQILVLMKGLPLTYNRDLQEDKEPLFDSINTITSALQITDGLLNALTFNRDEAAIKANSGFALATDVADYLVKKGVPFRESHQIVGSIVKYCTDNDKLLNQLSLKEYQKFSKKFSEDITKLDVRASLSNRNIQGGTAPNQVKSATNKAQSKLNQLIKKFEK
ncbi:MAG: argininosuccinate lyase [Dehalococcoidaceae bacterium]|nr:argininosuccinate lyase [Dehalococcoidaceae bacterium]